MIKSNFSFEEKMNSIQLLEYRYPPRGRGADTEQAGTEHEHGLPWRIGTAI